MDDKLEAFHHRAQTIIIDRKKSLPAAKQNALNVFDLVEPWLGESGAEYCLGAESTHSLADVVLTCMLARCTANAQFFEEEVMKNKRPNLAKYWKIA